MGVEITDSRREKKAMSNYIAERRLYLAEDEKTVVEEGDPRAAFLLAPEGGEVPEDRAIELGLMKAPRGGGTRKAPEPTGPSRNADSRLEEVQAEAEGMRAEIDAVVGALNLKEAIDGGASFSEAVIEAFEEAGDFEDDLDGDEDQEEPEAVNEPEEKARTPRSNKSKTPAENK